MNNITLSYVSRGSDGKVANHNTVVDMAGVTADDANVQALLTAQMKIKEQAMFAKKHSTGTNENISFAAFVARCMTKGSGSKALVDENERLKAQIAEYEKAMKK